MVIFGYNNINIIMKFVQIIHNPTAGLGKVSKNDLLNIFGDTGSITNYISTDEDDWKNHYQNKTDAIVVAGGDGTIHKFATLLLENKIPETRIPIHLLPLGTANNIARTLGISLNEEHQILNPKGKTREFDCGRVTGLPDEQFFLEGVGYGVIPELIAVMEKDETSNEIPAEKLKRTLKELVNIVKEFKAQKVKIKINGITIKGSFLLVELLNIKYIGPNLELAPNADPGDGFFELVMVPESARSEMLDYLKSLISGKPDTAEVEKFLKTVRVQKVKIKWQGDKLHIDDNLIEDYSGKTLKAEILPGTLEFLITK